MTMYIFPSLLLMSWVTSDTSIWLCFTPSTIHEVASNLSISACGTNKGLFNSILLNTLWALLLTLSSLNMVCFSFGTPGLGSVLALTTSLPTTRQPDSIHNKSPQWPPLCLNPEQIRALVAKRPKTMWKGKSRESMRWFVYLLILYFHLGQHRVVSLVLVGQTQVADALPVGAAEHL